MQIQCQVEDTPVHLLSTVFHGERKGAYNKPNRLIGKELSNHKQLDGVPAFNLQLVPHGRQYVLVPNYR